MLRPLCGLATFALALPLIASATPAHAGGPLTAEVSGGVITVQGSSKGDKIYVNFEDPSYVQISVSDMISWGSLPLTPGAGCRVSSLGASFTDCSTTGVTKVVVYANDGDDLVFTGVGWRSINANFSLPVEYHGGNGRDDLRGGPNDDFLYGEGGNDTQILGDKGDDFISGGEGDDAGLQGDGVGVNPSEFGADVIDGGPGTDTLQESRVGLDRTQFWSLDGVANDGSDLDDNPDNGAEEGDNVSATVENIVGTSEDDVILGSDANNVISGGAGDNTVVSLGGNDFVNLGYQGGSVDAGPGDDEILTGADALVLGGPGRDTIDAGGFIDAGPGMDNVTGGDSSDVIVITDGELDQVSCGYGADIIYADSVDVLDTERLCELEVGEVGTRKLLAGGINLTVTAPGGGRLAVTVQWGKKTLGTKAVATAVNGQSPVTIPLSASDKKRLAKLKSVPVTVRTAFTPAGATKPLRADRKVTLTR